jgi:hypothetical protein
MSKSKKVRTKQRRQGARSASRAEAIVSPSSESSGVPQSSMARLRAEAKERYRKKQIRRKIRNEFYELQEQSPVPDLKEIVRFLSVHFPEVDLAREALQHCKRLEDPWCVELWRILGSADPEVTAQRLLAQRQEVVDAQKHLILERVPAPLTVQVATTVDGPAFEGITPDFIHHLILQHVRADEAEVEFNFELESKDIPFSHPGEYQARLIFLNGDVLALDLKMELEQDEIPSDCESAWEHVDVLNVTPDSNVITALQEHLAAVPEDDLWTWYTGANRVLKTAYELGYWKAPCTQRLLEKWRQESQRVLLESSSRGDFRAMGMQEPIEIPSSIESVAEGDDAEKLRILNLPPLVAYDLSTASVDLNALQNLFRAPRLRHLRGKNLEELTEDDVRRMSYGINKEVTRLKRGQYGRGVGMRALGMILLSIARLQFDKLETGTCESAIRFCLSGYSTRMGEYLIEQHSRYDSARDYYLEAITLNLVSRRGVDFPTMMLFRSSFKGTRIRTGRDPDPGTYLRLLIQPEWHTQEVLESLTRSFVELGARHDRWADHWFEECPDDARQLIIGRIRNQLDLGEASFSDCVAAYKQISSHFETLLRHMQRCTSCQGILSLASELASRLQQLEFLLSPTNREIAQLLIEATEAVKGFVQSKSYEDQRNCVNTAINLLDRVRGFGADNRTALWAAYFNQIAEQWSAVLRQEFSTIAREIEPRIEVSLAEKAISLGEDGKARAIFRMENQGSGTADPVNIRFQVADSGCAVGPPSVRDFRLEPGEAVEGYFSLEVCSENHPLALDFELSYYDPDRQLQTEQSKVPLVIEPFQESEELQHLENPFRIDQEVDDPRMFVGRDHLLDEVCDYAITDGGLLMLHGQRRVGKSSLLLFIERRINAVAQEKKVVTVRVSWLDFAAHSVDGVIEELIVALQKKCRNLLGIELTVPPRDEIRASYSLAFNDVLRDFELHGLSRLVLLVDEFDVVVNQLDRGLGFDRMFFEYLRGLSKRGAVALVLTGGEMMPLLFDRLGEVFNHDRTWRIAYLSPTDGSVERLVENDYVRGYLRFNPDSISTVKEVTACNPCFVQMICQEIVDRSRRQWSQQVCTLDVLEVSDWLVRQSSTTKYVKHLYSPFQEPDSLDLAVIGVMAEEEMLGHRPRFVPQQRIVERIQQQYSDRVVTKIGELVRREILRRNPESSDELRIMLPLFRDWFHDNKPKYNLWAPLLRR